MRVPLALAAAALAVATVTPAHAEFPVECQAPVTPGPCFVHGPDGGYTCTLLYVGVRLGVGTYSQFCVFEYQP